MVQLFKKFREGDRYKNPRFGGPERETDLGHLFGLNPFGHHSAIMGRTTPTTSSEIMDTNDTSDIARTFKPSVLSIAMDVAFATVNTLQMGRHRVVAACGHYMPHCLVKCKGKNRKNFPRIWDLTALIGINFHKNSHF
ncbi:hypothetical protein Q1W73_03400 [Asticcacaulis sp. ZE23SCel15]|uniref:hypothetical protein n=1 Tax=Asticcacaulis sp. ZE23SCel15 TaxID=3059027 RepID=UPI00265E4CAB|nr:hypothetical protein [Asticcacaulis sp. ZE23SCel15]WKL58043.1 hypothetical protein Q1W73_03400 [Asticcacaulis sp. ZE23SCel15]